MKETVVGGLRVVTDGQVTTDVRSQTTTAELLRLSRRLAPRHRHRYEPVPFGRTSDLMGLSLSAQRRECRKRRPNRVRKGASGLRAVQCVRAAVKKKDSYHQAHYLPLEVRRGNTAILAVAASMLTAIFHMLRDGTM